MVDGGGAPRRRTRSWALRWPLLVAGLAFAVRIWAPGPVSQTFDERSWAARSVAFREAVTTADFDEATAAPDGQLATMPGVTTMWAGTAGWYLADLGASLGIVERTDRGSPEGPAILRAARGVVSLAVAATIWAIAVMVALLWGRRQAMVVASLLAVEPWLVGHSGVLHTDAFVAVFGFAGFVAFALCGKYLEAREAWRGPKGSTLADLPTVERWWPRAWAAVAGTFFALALLTKVNGAVLVAATVVIVPIATMVGPLRRGEARLGRRSTWWLTMVLVALGVAALVFVVAWPAAWVSPLRQFDLLWRSASQAGDPNEVFFHGDAEGAPGPWFYPVSTLFRLSPWLLLASLGAAATAAVHRAVRGPATPALRGLAASAVVVCASYGVAIATADKVYDRYALVFVPFLATAVAVVGVRAFDDLVAWRPALRPALRTGGGVVAVLIVVHVLSLAPYAISYADPLVGGQEAAHRWIPLGWGEGIEQLGASIEERSGGRCDEVTVATSWFLPDAVTCGSQVGWEWTRGAGERPDYAIVYVLATQRGLTPDQVAGLDRAGTLVDRVAIGGVTYAELWELAPEPAS